jgi:hypothetical protein
VAVSWQRLGNARGGSISIGANDSLWVAGAYFGKWDEEPQHWSDAPQAPDVPLAVAVSPDGRPWILTSGDAFQNNNIFEWDGASWQPRGGWGFHIAVGANDTVCHVGRGGAIYQYAGNNGWTVVPGAHVPTADDVWNAGGLHRIAVDPQGGCWHIGRGSEIFRPSGGGWQGMGAWAQALSIGVHDEIIHVGRGNTIFILQNGRWACPYDDAWAIDVSIDSRSRCIHLGRGKAIFRQVIPLS